MDKKIAEKMYDSYLKRIEKRIGNGITSESDLKGISNKLFGNKFKGVYAFDRKVNFEPGFYIINNGTRASGGIHWFGVSVDKNKKILTYDSFARKKENDKIMQGSAYTATEDDVEQDISEENCGARTIAFLSVVHVGGHKLGKWI